MRVAVRDRAVPGGFHCDTLHVEQQLTGIAILAVLPRRWELADHIRKLSGGRVYCNGFLSFLFVCYLLIRFVHTLVTVPVTVLRKRLLTKQCGIDVRCQFKSLGECRDTVDLNQFGADRLKTCFVAVQQDLLALLCCCARRADEQRGEHRGNHPADYFSSHAFILLVSKKQNGAIHNEPPLQDICFVHFCLRST